jgi:hypothetical protein
MPSNASSFWTWQKSEFALHASQAIAARHRLVQLVQVGLADMFAHSKKHELIRCVIMMLKVIENMSAGVE